MLGRVVYVLARPVPTRPRAEARSWLSATVRAALLLAILCPAAAADSETWLFNGTLHGFTCTGCTATAQTQYVRIDPGTTDPQFISPTGLSFVPATNCANGNYMRMAYRNYGGNATGQFYFQNASHGFSSSHTATFPTTSSGNDGWKYYTLALANSDCPGAGGIGDFHTGGTVTRIRIDPVQTGTGGSDFFDIDFIVLRMDTHPPCEPSLGVSPPSGVWTSGGFTVNVSGNDPPPDGASANCTQGSCDQGPACPNPDRYGSGVQRFEWRIGNSGPFNLVNVNESDFDIINGTATAVFTVPTSALQVGVNELYVRARDRIQAVGGPAPTEYLLYDPVAPDVTVVTYVEPTGWSADPTFYIEWNIPNDPGSGVDHFEWRLDGGSPNFIDTAGEEFTVSGSGPHTFQVRAIDAAGNIGPWSAGTTLLYDGVAPNPTGTPVAVPSGYSVDNSFTVTWTAGSDGHSGVAGYVYRVNGGPEYFTTDLFVSGDLATQVGPNTFEVRTLDNVDRVSVPNSATFYYYPDYLFPATGLTPSPGDSVALPQTFGWSPVEGGEYYEIQVATDAGFTSGLSSWAVDLPSTPVPASAAPSIGSVYFWRVRALGSVPSDNWSATQTFITIEAPPPPPGQIVGSEFPAGDAGEGVNTSLGAVTRSFAILALRGPGGDAPLIATYSSISQRASSLGPKWSWALGQQLDTGSPPFAVAALDDGQEVRFRWTGSAFETDLGTYDSLVVQGGGHEMIQPSRERLLFDAGGKLTRISDRNGNAIQLTYSGNDLVQFADQAGRVYQVTSSGGKVSQIQDVLGRQWHFEYDGAGYLSAFVDARGNRTEYEYDGAGRLTHVTDPRGNDALQCTYGGDSRVLTQTDAAGGVTTFTYDDLLRRTTITNPLSGTTVHVRDSSSRVVAEINARGDSTTYSYDAHHNRVAIRDGRGFTTAYEYDLRGNIVRITDPLGSSARTQHDFNNRPIEEVRPLGHVTRWTNDIRGNAVRVDEPLGRTTLIDYNLAGQVINSTDANNHATSHVYDGQGNRTSTTNGAGNVTQFGYDAAGRRTSMTDGRGNVTDFAYDAVDSLLSVTNDLPATVAKDYDANGNRTADVDALNRRTEFTYDAKNRLTREVNPLGSVTEYTYDALDRRITTRDPRGNLETSEYDPIGNLLRVTTALGFQTAHTYDANGNRVTTTDPRGMVAARTFDARNQLLTEASPLGFVTTSAYDSLGRATSRTDARGKVTTYSYDALDRLVSVGAANGGSITYGYDLVGNRTSRVNANGHPTAHVYDAADRLIQVTDPLGASESYGYDAAGNRIQRTDRKGQVTLLDYDAANRLFRERFPDATADTRTLDVEGNITALVDRWGTATYGYDAGDRLIQATDHDGRVLQFAYDSTGNRVRLTYPGGLTVRFGYDADDRLVSVTDWGDKTVLYGYDAAGNNTAVTHPNGVATQQTFDNDGRLISLLTTNASAETLVAVAYTLDPNGNRTRTVRVDRRADPVRDALPDPHALSAWLSERAYPGGADSVVAVSGELWDEAIVGGPLARRRNASLLVVPGDNLLASMEVVAEFGRLASLQPGLDATITGEFDGVSATVEAQIAAAGAAARRLAGANRVWTAAEAAGPCSLAVLINASDFQRAGATALFAGAAGAPVLYVYADSLPLATGNVLGQFGPAVILVGDGSMIGPPVTSWLASHGIAVRRHFTSGDPGTLSAEMVDHLRAGRPPADTLRLLSRDAWQDGASVGASINPASAALFVPPDDLDAAPDVLRWIGRNKGHLENSRLTGPETAISEHVRARLRNVLRTTVTDYAYDDLNELLSEVVPGVDSLAYAYDLLGNRTSITHNSVTQNYTYDGADRLVAAGAVTYTYDANGSRISRTLGSSLTTYEYDYRNRLVRVSAPEGESRYRYDGLGRRIRVEEPGSTTRYVVDPTAKPYETLEERDDSGTLRTAFVLGAGLVAERRANTDLRYFHFDGLGSTTAITDSTGVDVAHVAYHAFGDTAMDLGASDTRRGFVGRFGVEGTPTGLIFMRDRFYDSTIGQFLSEDPTLRADTEVLAAALHLYADGNPVLEIDPDGHEPITLLAMGITIGLAAYSAWEAHKSAKRAVTQQVAMDRARGISGERLTNRALTVGLTEYSTQLAWGWVMGKATKGVTPNVYGDQAAGLASEKGTGWAVSQLNRTYLYPALLGERSAAPKTKAPQMCKPVKPMVRMKPLGGLSSQHPAAYKAPAKFVPPQQKPKKTRR